jgi:hypothetical protein
MGSDSSSPCSDSPSNDDDQRDQNDDRNSRLEEDKEEAKKNLEDDLTEMVIDGGMELVAQALDVDTGDVGPFGGFIEQCDAIADQASPPP